MKKYEKTVVPLLHIFNDLVKKGVEVRLIHAKEPGQAFREDFDKYPALWSKMERRLCPRVHMKIVVMDSELVYIGSANLTGAGMGMKSAANRNFEAGILTDELGFIDAAMSHFDSIWEGTHCKQCGRKDFCLDRIKGNNSNFYTTFSLDCRNMAVEYCIFAAIF